MLEVEDQFGDLQRQIWLQKMVPGRLIAFQSDPFLGVVSLHNLPVNMLTFSEARAEISGADQHHRKVLILIGGLLIGACLEVLLQVAVLSEDYQIRQQSRLNDEVIISARGARQGDITENVTLMDSPIRSFHISDINLS